MFELSGAEIVGYVASALVVLSLSMTSVVRLRMISLAGSLTFVVYGLLIGAPPLVIANTTIACLNIWFLRKELGGGRDLGASVIPTDAPFLLDFLSYHRDDIRRFQPDYDPDLEADLALLLTRDGLPAGVLMGHRNGDELQVTVDYVMKAYRDSRLGHWLYGKGSSILRAEGIRRVATRPGNDTHRVYLEHVGFRPDEAGDCWHLPLRP